MGRDLLETHRRIFRDKPVLADVYGVWFDRLLADLPPSSRVLEAGAGPGLFAERARKSRPDLRWVAADIVRAPWNDVAADVHRLPFPDAAFDRVVGIDLVHHLREPLRFLGEAARVLKPAASACFIEPFVSPFSYPIYRFFHQEACGLGLDPALPFGAAEKADPFEGDAGVANALRRGVTAQTWRALGFDPPRFDLLNGFAYLASLGFKGGNLLPKALLRPLLAFDHAAPAVVFALRADLRLRRRHARAAP